MMLRATLLAAALVGATTALPEYMRASPNLELALASRALFNPSVTTYEDVLTRRLAEMNRATTATDTELREQAWILFKLYKALKPADVATMGETEEEQFEVFYKTVFQKILARVNATPTTLTPTQKPTKKPTARFSVTKRSNETEVAASLSFFTEVYDEDLAEDVEALQDNTENMEAIVQSTKADDDDDTDPANQFQSPTVLEGTDETPSSLDGSDEGNRRRLAATNGSVPLQVLFCDVGGNAIWKWSHTPYDPKEPINNTTVVDVTMPVSLCASPYVEVQVTTYQSGCSLKNHPEGCDNVYFKGCGGLTVNRAADRVVVARTGGRSLGMLYYKNVAKDQCQGRVVDVITTYKGKRFNSISYVEYSPVGDLYFTDSPFGLATGPQDFEGDILDKSPLRELDFNGVFMLKKGATKLDLLECAMDRPNKIAFSPKGDVMYITNSRKGNSYVKQFNLAEDGLVKSSSLFFNFTQHPELGTDKGYADGIKTDDKGNVYVAAYNGIFIFSPAGDLIGNLRGSKVVSGIALGGGRMFLSGSFGIVAQATGVAPSISLSKAKTDCA